MESEYINRKNKLIEYTKLHLISLQQDGEDISKKMDEYPNYEDDEYKDLEVEDISISGQIFATQHLLQIMEEML